MPPTQLYNEGWMLRLVLHWFRRHPEVSHELMFAEGARWYSEGLLPSQFLPQKRGDRRAESHTHADGIIGHFDVAPGLRSEISLRSDALQCVVIEAKMGSALSRGTKNAPDYDQAARNVGCLVHLVDQARLDATQMDVCAFYVVAPQSQIDAGVFGDLVTKESIKRKVLLRVDQYAGTKKAWYETVFLPTLESIAVATLSWETIFEFIEQHDLSSGYREFYSRCLEFNPVRGTSGANRSHG